MSDFLTQFPAKNPNTLSEQEFQGAARSAQLLFQFTDAEIELDTSGQGSLLTSNSFDKGDLKSFLFVAVELEKDRYPRGRYAAFTREINKRLSQPAVVLFRTTCNLLTLAFVHRREHKRDKSRDVLGSVSLIREISLTDAHRAHLDILDDLKLDERLTWMQTHGKRISFDGLLAAWLAALDTEELNRRFYRELADWFERAGEEATFPTGQAITLDPEEHLIRLITRLLFVWFMKEKGLVNDHLFVEEQVKRLLKDYDGEKGDSYYRAVLQNLFFATLNTEMGKRRFSRGQNVTHRDFSLYRYKQEMADPERLADLFAETPFINGGLFDCLDSEEAATEGGYRIDCFTDNATNPRSKDYGLVSIPNRLFFDEDDARRGLITLFNRYKFTVQENTPVDQEVALDPELLGKVFENLLAAYNPETRESARKQTGSYYTPRPVVDYMVDEALVASLALKCQPTDGDSGLWQGRLRYLLDYGEAFDDADEWFDADETEGLVRAIAGLQVLDPAVGSGAFPMGVLHKLTLALKRLDRNNERWEALQKERATERAAAAFDAPTREERDDELAEISNTFERYRDSDFGRKLYLMQNSIFGVDIQPIACQIAKLRFFISLAIEQERDRNTTNLGIKPLPNLETRFVAADTLLPLDTVSQLELFRQQIETLKARLAENRERHFHATARREKLACKDKDRELRRQLSEVLHEAGLPGDDASKIAQWDPYDQNAMADWFNAEYMFDSGEGFDVVLGNPPYIQLQKNEGSLGKRYQGAGYKTFTSTGDIYQLFYEEGCHLLRPERGVLAYITSNSWLKAKYGRATRRFIAGRHAPLQLLEMGKDIFENTIVDTNILLVREGSSGKSSPGIAAVDMDQLDDKDFPPNASLWGQTRPQDEEPWSILSLVEHRVMDKMRDKGTSLKHWSVRINYGIKTGYNEAFIIDDATRQMLLAEDPKSREIIRPMLRGRDIQRYQAQWAGLWLIATFPALQLDIEDYPAVKEYLLFFGKDRLEQSGKNLPDGGKSRKWTSHSWFELQDSIAYHEEFDKEKLVWIDLTNKGRFAYDDSGMLCLNTAFVMTSPSIKFLCAMLNSRLATFFMERGALNSGMGVPRWILHTVETIPVPEISEPEQRAYIDMVNRIISEKRADPNTDTAELEAEIDQLVYELYGLTDKEIAAVEQ